MPFSPRANKTSYSSSFLLEYANLVKLKCLTRIYQFKWNLSSSFLRFSYLLSLVSQIQNALLSRKGSSHQNRDLNLLHSYPRRCSAHHTCICPWRSSFSGFIHENIQNTSVISAIRPKAKTISEFLVFDSSNEKAVIHTILL